MQNSLNIIDNILNSLQYTQTHSAQMQQDSQSQSITNTNTNNSTSMGNKTSKNSNDIQPQAKKQKISNENNDNNPPTKPPEPDQPCNDAKEANNDNNNNDSMDIDSNNDTNPSKEQSNKKEEESINNVTNSTNNENTSNNPSNNNQNTTNNPNDTNSPNDNLMDIDEENETDPKIIEATPPPSSTLKLQNKTSYPMPSPRPRRKSSSRVFNPSEYKQDDNVDLKSNDDNEETNLEASVSALPPLVATKSTSSTNQYELYGWGCVDPLLYAAKSGKTPRVSVTGKTIKMDIDGNNNEEEEDDDDEIIKARCLIEENTMKFNFNDISANFNGACIWQRDVNGFMGWGDNEDGAVGDGVEFQIKEPKDMHAFRDRPVRFVSIGEKHTGVILQYGGLYVFGCNENVCISEKVYLYDPLHQNLCVFCIISESYIMCIFYMDYVNFFSFCDVL